MQTPVRESAAPAGRRLRLALGAAGLAAVAVVLYLFDPSRHAFYPQCVFHGLTGWSCPGCGSLRALHQLLHGRIGAAFDLNPLLVALLPLLGLAWGRRVWAWLAGRAPEARTLAPVWTWLLLAVIVGFSVARNLPATVWPPFGS